MMDSQTVEQPERLTAPSIVLGVSSLTLILVLALTTAPPAVGTILLFGALYGLSQNLDVEGPSGAGVSAGLMIVVASIVVFTTRDTPLGAVLVGLFGSLFVPHLRRREWQKLLYNAAMFSLGIGVGTAVFALLPGTWVRGFPLLLLSTALGALAYYTFNVLCVSYAVARLRRRPARYLVLALWTSQWLVYPFAFLGAGLGWLEVRLGTVPLMLTVTPILIARHAFASYMRAREANEAAVQTLVRSLEAKDHYTAGHAERVAAYARYIGEELGLSPWALERLHRAALMHDIGKLVVPNQLLNKPGRLTGAEYERVRQHEEVTVDLLARIDFLAPVAPIALGVYGAPLADDRSIPIERYIVAVADAYDAMTSTRAYRRALPQTVAFDELRGHAGTQFHPRCVDALISALERQGLRHGAGHEPADAANEWPATPPASGPGSAGLGDLADDHAR